MAKEAKTEVQLGETTSLGRLLMMVLGGAPLCLTAFVLLYRPVTSANPHEFLGAVLYGMLLLAALFLWVCHGALDGTIRWRGGSWCVVFALFLAAVGASCAASPNWFSGARVLWILGTYGLTAFMVLQVGTSEGNRRFLLSCLLATTAMLAAFALLHLWVYLPAFRKWIAADQPYWMMQLGVTGGMFRDFEIRVRGERAFGQFLTSNQLAAFMVMGAFVLGGIVVGLVRRGGTADVGRRRAWLRPNVVGCAAVTALVLFVLYRSGSKGVLVSFVFGIGVFGMGVAGGWIRRHVRAVGVAAAALLVLFVGGQLVGLAPPPSRFAASFRVRWGYWGGSLQMAREHPLLGVGPTFWDEHYFQFKSPGHEETRMAHSAYLQVLAENGIVGLVLLAALWALLGLKAWRGVAGVSAAGSPEGGSPPEEAQPGRGSRLTTVGLTVAALALVFDYLFVGSFHPARRFAPKLLDASPWLPYVGMFAVWAIVFHLMHNGFERGRRPPPLAATGPMVLWGLLAAVAAFLFHSIGETTFQVPAIGATAFALVVLVLAETSRRPLHEMRLPEAARAAAIIVALLPALACALVVAPRVIDFAAAQDIVLFYKGDLSAPGPVVRAKARKKMLEAYRTATRKLPWDDDSWQKLAAYTLRYGEIEEAENAARRAVELNPLRASNWSVRADVARSAARLDDAAGYLHEAAKRHPSLPRNWLDYGNGAEQAGLKDEACEAYRKAAALNGKQQYHKRNRLSREERKFLRERLEACGQEERDTGGAAETRR